MMSIATCGGARLGECPLAVQTEAGIPSTIQIQPPLPSDKDDDGDDDLEDDDNDHADDCNADGGGDDNNDGDDEDGCYNDDVDYQKNIFCSFQDFVLKFKGSSINYRCSATFRSFSERRPNCFCFANVDKVDQFIMEHKEESPSYPQSHTKDGF